ncbi:hypothetical protein GALL_510740 [mine drainage metagenome]|uniref:Uncharacterized protein n=1 Tax=mine drainage metagenome TaxID=410659 RepID=A0A1J5PPX6_9ZZZZ
MVQQQVASADAVEDFDVRAGPCGGHARGVGREQHLRFDHVVEDFLQAHEVDGPVHPVAVLRHDIVLALQAVDDDLRTFGGHFQPDRIAIMPRTQFALKRRAQIGDVVVVEENLAVAGDAELVHAQHGQPRKELAGECLHEGRKQYETVARIAQIRWHGHDAGQGARCLYHAEFDIAAERVGAVELHREIQALVEHAREGVRRVEADGGQQRRDLGIEVMLRPFGLRRSPVGGEINADPLLFQFRQYRLLQHPILVGDQAVRTLGNDGQDVACQHAVRCSRQRVRFHHVLQRRHPGFKKLVHIARHDAEKPQPFEQGIGVVERLKQHAAVEFESAQLTIEQARCGGGMGHE